MTPSPCPFWAEVGRAGKATSDVRLRGHVQQCQECREGLALIERAASALKAAPYRAPSDDAREQARTRLVAAIGPTVAARPAPRRWWVKVVVPVVASLFGATVVAAVGTRVLEGRRQAEQARAAAKARDRHARGDVMAPAPVASPSESPPTAPAPLTEGAPAPPRPARVRPAAGMTEPVSLHTSPAERAFNQGWLALRAGDHRGGAALMERAVGLQPAGVLAEDARYWRAIALGRAGATGPARAAMEEFRRLHPGSRRAGEVAAMLGWLLVDAGERGRAGDLFRAALADPNPAVRQSARAGLDVVAPGQR
jgi:TolA-binding protein